MIVAFTGHRPDKLGEWDPLHPCIARIRKALRDELAREWPHSAICGMAQGFDTWAAETCVELGIPFTAALPCDGMDDIWSMPTRERFRGLLHKAKEIRVVSPGPYKPWKLQRRNEYLVDHCDRLVAAWNGDMYGGTYNCLEYAASIQRKVVYLDWHKDVDAVPKTIE